MEPEGSLPCLQEPITGSCVEPDASSPRQETYLRKFTVYSLFLSIHYVTVPLSINSNVKVVLFLPQEYEAKLVSNIIKIIS